MATNNATTMKISELIAKLEQIQAVEGDINVCVSEAHEYWGSLESLVCESNITVSDHAQPLGPKSGKSERAIIIGR